MGRDLMMTQLNATFVGKYCKDTHAQERGPKTIICGDTSVQTDGMLVQTFFSENRKTERTLELCN